MKTIPTSDDIVKKFNRAAAHCAWLLESIKPVSLFLIDAKDGILSYFNYHLDALPKIDLQTNWLELKKACEDGFISEGQLYNVKAAMISSHPISDLEAKKIFEYIRMTMDLDPFNSMNDRISRLNLKDTLVHLLHCSNYARKLDKVHEAFVDFLANCLNETAALFLLDNSISRNFLFYTVSNNVDKDGFENLTFTIDEIDGDTSQWMSETECLTGNGKKKVLLFPLRNKGKSFALLLLTNSSGVIDHPILKRIKVILDQCAELLFAVQRYIYINKMSGRYQQLFDVAKKFHSTMDDREVLDNVLQTIVNYYPGSDVQLLYADNESSVNTHQDAYALQAFLSGTVQLKKAEPYSFLYAPLSGRQGVYGVIEIKTKEKDAFPKEDIDFVHFLGHTAGHAFENARLYQQSQRSISDLRLINRTSQELNAHRNFQDTVDYLLKEIHENFPVEELGFIILEKNRSPQVYPKSTSFFHSAEGLDMIFQVVDQINESCDGMFRGDIQSEDWENQTYRSLIALPMIFNDSIAGLIVAVHSEPYHFSFDDFRLLQAIVRHSTLAISNARLREELELQVNTDQLTSLYAREYLNEKVDVSLQTDQSGVMVLFDIDNFKMINDTHGHIVGDEILVTVAKIIKQNIRKTDIAARWGGEELAVYLPDCDVSQAANIAERIVKCVEESTQPRVTVSCGMSYWQALDFKGGGRELFICADQALYRAKREGKNRLYIYDRG
ncbi:MAG: diguanylate cyclase [Tuberibacillus sp.]